MLDFKAKIGIGINGVALFTITAEVANGYKPYPDNWTPREAMLEDINGIGIDEWFEYLPISKPPAIPGIYCVTGSVHLTEDSYDYSNIQISVITEL